MTQASGIKIAGWARAEQRKKAREENRGRVRGVFGFLFGAAVLVYIYSDHAALQNYIYGKVGPLLVSHEDHSNFKTSALRHEREINQINP